MKFARATYQNKKIVGAILRPYQSYNESSHRKNKLANNRQRYFFDLRIFHLLLLFIAVFSPSVFADNINIAVAANFSKPMQMIAKEYEQSSGNSVTLIYASTGKLYTQIINGAPFDVLFAADTKTPLALEQQGKAVSNTRFTYAVGRIVLWSANAQLIDGSSKILQQQKFNYLAIANPKLAPYGAAAIQTMRALELQDVFTDRIVQGENISQAFQMVASGNAELGFVALSQIKSPKGIIKGSQWLVPETLYQPILQQAILLRDSDPAQNFLTFVKTNARAHKIIESYGYHLPE